MSLTSVALISMAFVTITPTSPRKKAPYGSFPSGFITKDAIKRMQRGFWIGGVVIGGIMVAALFLILGG